MFSSQLFRAHRRLLCQAPKPAWVNDQRFAGHKKNQGRPNAKMDLSTKAYKTPGPYGRPTLSWKHAPQEVVTCCVMVFVVFYTIFFKLDWSTNYFRMRDELVREKIRREFGLPKGWEDMDTWDEEDLQRIEVVPLNAAMEELNQREYLENVPLLSKIV